MQPFPYAAHPMSAGGVPVPGVPMVPNPAHPISVSPSLTQYPAAPPGWGPMGYAMPQPSPFLPAAQGTYLPGMAGFPLPASPHPGTPGLQSQGAVGPGSVAGVSFEPVQAVPAPAVTGGPHPLPPIPQLPLPQGFPNPFELRQVPVGAGTAQAAAPLPPGATAVTGPRGYLPGLGYFGPPPPPNAFPTLPGAFPSVPPQAAAGQQPQVMASAPPLPQPPSAATPLPVSAHMQAAAPMAVPAALPVAAPLTASPTTMPSGTQPAPPPAMGVPASPFWLHLAWQLVQSPPVRQLLGEQLEGLLADAARGKTLSLAAACLLEPELQQAFRALSAGLMEQTRFIELFAERFKAALAAVAASAE